MVLAGIDLTWQSNKNPTAIACGEITHNVLSVTTIHPAVYGIESVLSVINGGHCKNRENTKKR
jgi:predicted RNase H-like nuclease